MVFLEYYPFQGPAKNVPLNVLPFRVGRGSGAHFVIPSSQVSKEHVEIFQAGQEYRIRDLGSTNGTYLNGQRISEAGLGHDDVFHVADEEFRFLLAAHPDLGEDLRTQPLKGQLPMSVARGMQHLEELLTRKDVRILFQPIVNMETKETVGFEALGRGMHEHLSTKPYDLFRLADRCGKVATLSELFRAVAVEECPRLPKGPFLFLNIHPSEIHQAGFLDHLAGIRELIPPNRLPVLEIHEDVACDFPTMNVFRQRLRELDILVAYDDFGAGQARFLELAELPPDFVKLDMSLIRNIDRAAPRRNLIRALARFSLELGIRVIAEGVETAEEAQVCQELGCQFAQGYFFGMPRIVEAYTSREQTHCLNVADLRARLREAAKA